MPSRYTQSRSIQTLKAPLFAAWNSSVLSPGDLPAHKLLSKPPPSIEAPRREQISPLLCNEFKAAVNYEKDEKVKHNGPTPYPNISDARELDFVTPLHSLPSYSVSDLVYIKGSYFNRDHKYLIPYRRTNHSNTSKMPDKF